MKVSELVIQYRLETKYPKPKDHPNKNEIFLFVWFLSNNKNIRGNVKKFRKIILYGGRLKEVINPSMLEKIITK